VTLSDRDTAARREDAADLRDAYERGRKDAKQARRRHPVAMTFTIVAAIVGVIVLALAAINGSFSGAGAVVDQNLATAAVQAEPVVRDAATQAGQAVKDAAAGDASNTNGTDASATPK
jgi:cytochrome bd-type quinol oxidase subunit 1